MPDTIQCPNCGEVNDAGNAVCKNCHSPFTAYGGQLTGERYQGRLAEQASATQGHPPIVMVIAAFNLAFALFVLGLAVRHFQDRPTINEEGSNAINVATSTFGAIVWAIFLVPLALALIGLAVATWTQRTWTWTANAVGVGVFAFLCLFAFGFSTVPKVICVGIALILGVLWFLPKTKAWFGLT
ncbi:MAG TPA: hypothetical protein VKU00_20695 [Chthonomonadaceae bacterium]|nr:hypothetical protein [Chthonomonadaceae bacterium]